MSPRRVKAPGTIPEPARNHLGNYFVASPGASGVAPVVTPLGGHAAPPTPQPPQRETERERSRRRCDYIRGWKQRRKSEGHDKGWRKLRPRAATEAERLQRRRDDRRARIARNRARADAIKLERGCVDCGYRQYAVALDFDHVRGGKESNVSLGICDGRTWEWVEREIAKCEVVCANCHRVRTQRQYSSGAA